MRYLLLALFVPIGVLIIVFNRRLSEAFDASNRAFYGNLLGEERTDRWMTGRFGRFNRVYGRVFLVIFGIAWTALSLLGLFGPLFGLGD